MNQPTHVLAWSPGYLSGDGSAAWELHTAADRECYRDADFPPALKLPRDAPVADLAAWVAGHLGHLVTLTAGTCLIQPCRLSRGHREPLFWVYPVVMPPVSSNQIRIRN